MRLETRRKIIRYTAIIGLVITFVISYIIAKNNTFKESFSEILKNSGIFAPIVFIIFEIIQTTYPVVPFGISNGIRSYCFWTYAADIYVILLLQ